MQIRFRTRSQNADTSPLAPAHDGLTVPACGAGPLTGQRMFGRRSPPSGVTPGLWFVPTAEVIQQEWLGVCRLSHRAELQARADTNVTFHPATFAIGVGNRVEMFGPLRAVTRVDRDINPLFVRRAVRRHGRRRQ